MTVIFQIAKNTWRECLRQPIFVILLLSALSIIGAYPGMVLFAFRGQQTMVIDGSLATILLFSLMTSVLCASHTVSREISTGTVLLVLSKPVSRDAFIIAKILGILGAITLFAWTTSLAALIALKGATDQFRFDPWLMGGFFTVILLAVLVGVGFNYYGKRSFPSACAKALGVGITIYAVIAFFMPEWDSNAYNWAKGPSYFDANVSREVVLIIFAAWAMATMATALSTRFNLMSNMTICMAIFMVGLVSDWMHLGIKNMQLAELEQLMHSWYYVLFPVVITTWVMAVKHVSLRKNTKVKVVEIHSTFGIATLALLMKAVTDGLAQVHLEQVSPWMSSVALILFKIKDAAADVIYAAIPNWQQFWLADAVAAGKVIPAAFMGLAAGYIAVFIIAFTILAIILFTGREVGNQEGRL